WYGCGGISSASSDFCPALITKQGYNCCSLCFTISYIDDDGNWDIENNDWCSKPINC
ncbi:hypothetical protein H8356DRAFT_938569, partial [Neocallimastix lanati (nom. inval.)]